MEFNITFGTRRTTRSAIFQKHEDKPVITIEREKDAGKSRRMLFNKSAMEELDLEEGTSQEILFGFVEQDAEGNRRLLIANITGNQDMLNEVTYSTSKNKIAYEGSKEKGKGLASKLLMKEINEFLEVETTVEHEYVVTPFNQENMPDVGVILFELVKIESEKTVNANDDFTPVEQGAPFDEDLIRDIDGGTYKKDLESKKVEPITMNESTVNNSKSIDEEF